MDKLIYLWSSEYWGVVKDVEEAESQLHPSRKKRGLRRDSEKLKRKEQNGLRKKNALPEMEE